MNQKLVIIRGTACTGKTTICTVIRDPEKKIAWLSADQIKPIFSDYKDSVMSEVHETFIVVLNNLFDRGYNVIIDGIFKNPEHFYDCKKLAESKNIPVVAYQLECSLETLKKRDKERDGVRHGLWKPLGDELVESLYRRVEDNPVEGVIKINTEEKILEECISEIRKNFT